jgi:putative SOS response-associated peptidase YedK
MCGYIGNITDSPLAVGLMELLGLDAGGLFNNPGTGPAEFIDIIASGTIKPALWWLLLDRHRGGQLGPSKYTSFNTRSDKLHQQGKAGYIPYRKSRCIIPATYIIEGEGYKGHRIYHKIEPTTRAFGFGGLYRSWLNEETGEEVLSCSVITLPPHEKWKGIHSKSTPLFLPAEDKGLIHDWLDPSFSSVERFEHLLQEPMFHDRLVCTPIERPGNQLQVGEPVIIC